MTRVDDDGLTLDAGLLSRVSVGSLYGSIDPEDDSRVRITQVGDTWSHGRVERGRASVADVLTEGDCVERTIGAAAQRLSTADCW